MFDNWHDGKRVQSILHWRITHATVRLPLLLYTLNFHRQRECAQTLIDCEHMWLVVKMWNTLLGYRFGFKSWFFVLRIKHKNRASQFQSLLSPHVAEARSSSSSSSVAVQNLQYQTIMVFVIQIRVFRAQRYNKIAFYYIFCLCLCGVLLLPRLTADCALCASCGTIK